MRQANLKKAATQVAAVTPELADFQRPTSHHGLESFGKNWNEHHQHQGSEHHLRHAAAHSEHAEHHEDRELWHVRKAREHGDTHEGREHSKKADHHGERADAHNAWAERHHSLAGVHATASETATVQNEELAYRAPTAHERLQGFGKNAAAHAKIGSAMHHYKHATAHNKLASFHMNKAASAGRKMDRLHSMMERHGKNHHLYDKWQAKHKALNSQMKQHHKLEAHHDKWREVHNDHYLKLSNAAVRKHNRKNVSPEAKRSGYRPKKNTSPKRTNTPSRIRQRRRKLAQASVELAASPHLRHFGKNAKFHAAIADSKHHLDHAHEHLAQAKHHHESLLNSEHPHEVLHHSKMRNSHAKWAETHISHFHALEGRHPVHSSVEVASAEDEHHQLAHTIGRHLKAEGTYKHNPEHNHEHTTKFDHPHQGLTPIARRNLHEHLAGKGFKHTPTPESKGHMWHNDHHIIFSDPDQTIITSSHKNHREHSSVEGSDPFVQAAVETASPYKHHGLTAAHDNFGKNKAYHDAIKSKKHHLMHAEQHGHQADKFLRAVENGEHDHYPNGKYNAIKAVHKHERWMNYHRQKAGEHTGVLLRKRDLKTGKPIVPIAEHSSVEETAGGSKRNPEDGLENFGKNWKAHKEIDDPKHHKKHADAHDRKGQFHENKALNLGPSLVDAGKTIEENEKAGHSKKNKPFLYSAKDKIDAEMADHEAKAEHHFKWADKHREHIKSLKKSKKEHSSVEQANGEGHEDVVKHITDHLKSRGVTHEKPQFYGRAHQGVTYFKSNHDLHSHVHDHLVGKGYEHKKVSDGHQYTKGDHTVSVSQMPDGKHHLQVHSFY